MVTRCCPFDGAGSCDVKRIMHTGYGYAKPKIHGWIDWSVLLLGYTFTTSFLSIYPTLLLDDDDDDDNDAATTASPLWRPIYNDICT